MERGDSAAGERSTGGALTVRGGGTAAQYQQHRKIEMTRSAIRSRGQSDRTSGCRRPGTRVRGTSLPVVRNAIAIGIGCPMRAEGHDLRSAAFLVAPTGDER